MTTATKPGPKKLVVGDIIDGARMNSILLTAKSGTVVKNINTKEVWMLTEKSWINSDGDYGMNFKADDKAIWKIINL